MSPQPVAVANAEGLRLNVRGIVQGVGFRPATLRLARDHHVTGTVRNEGTAVVIEAFAATDDLAAFVDAVRSLRRGGARVDALQTEPLPGAGAPADFRVVASTSAQPGLGIAPDLAACPDCVAETLDPFSRRYRYPFTACTDCGPRLSVFVHTPYDRNNTTLAAFPLCKDCAKEYADIDDRRFHAEATACHACGPRATLRRMDGKAFALDALSFPRGQSAVRLGEDLVLDGRQLGAADTTALFSGTQLPAPVELPPLPGDAPGTLRVHLPDASEDPDAASRWAPGICTVALRVQPSGLPPLLSNELPLALAPTITLGALAAAAGDFTLQLGCMPRIRPGQRVLLLFGDRVLAPASLVNPADPKQPTALDFQLTGVTAGSYVVRLRVDGADSIPVDFSGSAPAFAADQQVVVS